MGKAKAKRRDLRQNNQLKPKHTRITLNTTQLAFLLKDKLAVSAKKTGTNIKDPNSLMPTTAEADRHTEQERLAAGSGLRQALGHFRKSGCAGRDLCQWKRKRAKESRSSCKFVFCYCQALKLYQFIGTNSQILSGDWGSLSS